MKTVNFREEINKSRVFLDVSKAAKKIGVQVYVVGGFVRDLILGLENDDIDFLCVGNGIKLAEEYSKMIGGKLTVYENFGTAMVEKCSQKVEFVGARKEVYERGSRKPFVFDGSLEDDIKRRDFTINAMCISLNDGSFGDLVDIYGGMGDLEKGVIKCVGEPNERFAEDPLRMLRAIRFAVRFNFDIDEQAYEGIKRNADRLKIISAERITTELNKILMSPNPARGIDALHDTGLLRMFLPEVSALDNVKVVDGVKHKNNFIHTLCVLLYVARHGGSLNVRWAALLHDIGKIPTRKFEDGGWTFKMHEYEGGRMVEGIFKRLKLPIDDMKAVKKLVEMHMRPQTIVEDSTDSAIRRLMFDAGEGLEDLMLLCMGDVTSKNEDKVNRIREGFELLKRKFVDLEERDHIRNFQPPVKGDEIMAMLGLEPGPMVGKVKDDVKDAILDGKLENDREKVIEYIIGKYLKH